MRIPNYQEGSFELVISRFRPEINYPGCSTRCFSRDLISLMYLVTRLLITSGTQGRLPRSLSLFFYFSSARQTISSAGKIRVPFKLCKSERYTLPRSRAMSRFFRQILQNRV